MLDAANKDGGAHVDHTLTPEYEKLIDDHWYLATTKGGVETKVPFTEMHLLMLRQIGYELLNSPELTRLAS